MRDMTQVNGQGIGKSRGFAFVNFTEHAHALQVLRTVNNNPEIFGENKVGVSYNLRRNFTNFSQDYLYYDPQL